LTCANSLDADVVMIPSGYKATKLYSQIGTDGVDDFDVARNSIATRVNKSGLIEEVAIDVPRLDYSDGACPVLLTEPQSTNLVTYSEDFSDVTFTYWQRTRTSLGFTNILSPDGTNNASELIEDTSSNDHYLRCLTTLTPTNTYTYTIYIKPNTRTNVQLKLNGQATSEVLFNLSTGIIHQQNPGVIGASIDSYVNGWFKISATWVHSTGKAELDLLDGSFNAIYQGDGVSSVYVWGGMIENLSYPTSYIKTEGATVTRLTDVVNNAGDATSFADAEGVLYINSSALFDSLSDRVISINDASLNNRIYISYSSTTNQIAVDVIDGGVSQASMTHTLTDETDYSKIAVKWKVNDCALWVDGVEVATDATCTMPSGLADLSFNDGNSANNFYGKTKAVKVYPFLNDTQLAQLTTTGEI